MRHRLACFFLASACGACGGGVSVVDPGDAAADATVTARDGGPTPPVDAAGPVDAGGRSDAGLDSGPRGDDAGRAPDAAVACGTGAACTGAQVCCAGVNDAGPSFTCQTSCGDGGFTLACDGPEDCTPAGAHCCATLTLAAGTFPFCPPTAGNSRCRQVCEQQIPFACQATGQVRLCKAKADCAADNDGYTECCTFSQGGASATFCATTQVAAFAQACAP